MRASFGTGLMFIVYMLFPGGMFLYDTWSLTVELQEPDAVYGKLDAR